jgi:phospholipid-binding lipoprotein MlaA
VSLTVSRAVALASLAGLALSGCASQGFSIRSVPDETPAASNAATLQMLAAAANSSLAVAAAGSGQGNGPALIPLTPADAPSMYTYDPLERLNRFTYRFNARFDESVFLPAANGYRRIPAPLRAGVHNFFGNLSEVKSTVNYLIQWRLPGGARSLGRFVINSTLGIGGLFDVATRLKLENQPTGFGTTLSKWGAHPGPFLVIPLLGPSTLRDGIGMLGDFGIGYAINVADLYRGGKSWALDVVEGVDTRANVSFRYYGSGSPFEYETIRFLYVRKALIEDDALRGKNPLPRRDPATPAGE